MLSASCGIFFFFFFNDTATTEIYTLSLHDALPISTATVPIRCGDRARRGAPARTSARRDRKSTLLNSSHPSISYAVFCLNKKKTTNADQVNSDGDGEGDACDADDDNDALTDATDNCRLAANAGQADNDAAG